MVSNSTNDIKALKQELADLLDADAKADKLRSLPLYSCRITSWKFVCSNCYDKVYLYATTKQRKKIIDTDVAILFPYLVE